MFLVSFVRLDTSLYSSSVPETSSRDLRVFVTNFAGDGISVIDLETMRVVSHVATGSKPHGVAIAPDGSEVYVSNEGDGSLSIIDPRKNAVLKPCTWGEVRTRLPCLQTDDMWW